MATGMVKAPVHAPSQADTPLLPARESAPLLGKLPDNASFIYVQQPLEGVPSLEEKRLQHTGSLAAVAFVFSLLTAVLSLASIFVPWLSIRYLSTLCVCLAP